MNITWQRGRKPHDIIVLSGDAAERINKNFDKLYQDMGAQALAIAAKKINLASSDDRTGILPPTSLGGATSPDTTKFYREDGSFAVPAAAVSASSRSLQFVEMVNGVRTTVASTSTEAASGAAAAQVDAGGDFRRLTTNGTNNNPAHIALSSGVCWMDHAPTMTGRFRTGADVSNIRLWFALFKNGVAYPSSSDTPADIAAGIRYSTAAGDTGWRGFYCTSAPAITLTSAILAVAASTIYDFIVDFDGTTLTFSVNDNTAQLTPSGITGVLMDAVARHVNASANNRSVDYQRIVVESN